MTIIDWVVVLVLVVLLVANICIDLANYRNEIKMAAKEGGEEYTKDDPMSDDTLPW